MLKTLQYASEQIIEGVWCLKYQKIILNFDYKPISIHLLVPVGTQNYHLNIKIIYCAPFPLEMIIEYRYYGSMIRLLAPMVSGSYSFNIFNLGGSDTYLSECLSQTQTPP